MSTYVLKFHLDSDLCVSDGSCYNSLVDTDICYDKYGFPYIPAKRVRGCLRECAQELNDWGCQIPVEKLFGKAGNESAKVRIGNAYVSDYESKRKEALENSDNAIFHPQNILNRYSYIRTQTAIDYGTGVADDTSLRTMRVVRKGLDFISYVTIADNEDGQKLFEYLEMCCHALKNMGVARSRGLGEVTVSLEPAVNTDKYDEYTGKYTWEEGADCLNYSLLLTESLICKSVARGEQQTQDYIEGSKILGIIAQLAKENGKAYAEFNRDYTLACSNVYPECNGERLTEVPASYYSIKNDDEEYVDKTYETEADRREIETSGKQLNSMGHCYVVMGENGLVKYNVTEETRYHHSRPADKSIGRAYEKDANSKFYQISSITAGQVFSGSIMGTPEQIEEIYNWISANPKVFLGFGKTSEYGEAMVSSLEAVKCKASEIETDRIMVKLEAPTIVYNDHAMCSVNASDLVEETTKCLNLEGKIAKVEKFLNYTAIGGFQVTWGYRKPTLDVFDKGTVLVLELNEKVKITVAGYMCIGERTKEGYGEISVSDCQFKDGSKYYNTYAEDNEVKESKPIAVEADSLAYEIAVDLFEEFVKTEATKTAQKGSFHTLVKSAVSNMILMCKEAELKGDKESCTVEKISAICKERFEKSSSNKKEKSATSEKIVKQVDADIANISDTFMKQYNITGFKYDKQDIGFLYLKELLREIKYVIRHYEKTAGKN